MPLKLIEPRGKGKSPNYTIRGTYLGVAVDRSSKTDRKAVAAKILNDLQGKIERGEYPERTQAPSGPTFLSAAIAYIQAGRTNRYAGKLMDYFLDKPISEIDQSAVDTAAAAIYPRATPATRNRCVYTPLSAILRHAGVKLDLSRPKGSKGRTITDYLSEEDAGAIIKAAGKFDPEFALLLKFLLYTGVRLGTALALRWDAVNFDKGMARVATTKNGDPIVFRLRTELLEAMALHKPQEAQGRVFRFHQGGHMKHQLLRAKLGALGLECPARRPDEWKPPENKFKAVNFHTFRHTWATWMRLYGGLDLIGLVATNNWRDPRSAARYAHAVARDEWNKVESLPSVGGNIVETPKRRA